MLSESVGEFVLNRMSNMLLRPRMYAESPDAFDAILFVLDEIYAKYGNPKPAQAKYESIVDYIREQGCGSDTYCSYQRRINSDITNDELWSGITNAWREYLSEFNDHVGGSGEQNSDAPA